MTCTEKPYKLVQAQNRQGGAWRGPHWASPGTGNKRLLHSPGAWAAASPAGLGIPGWAAFLLLLTPQRPHVSGSELSRRIYTLGNPPQLLTHSARLVALPGIEPRRPAPALCSLALRNKTLLPSQQPRTVPPTQKSPPDASLEAWFP